MYLPFGFQLTPWVRRLLIANGAVFVATMLFPDLIAYLAFQPLLVLRQPWTIVTYMFAHGGFWHIFFNMVGLFFFGPPLESQWGSSNFIKYYAACGLGGAAFSYIFAPHAAVIGASAAIFGVMLAFAMTWPNAPIYIWGILPIKAKWLVGIMIALQFVSVAQGAGGGVAYFAHIGGFVVGFLYLKWGPLAGTHRGGTVGFGGAGTGARPSGSRGLGSRLRKLGRRPNLRALRDEKPGTRGTEQPRRRVDDRVLDEIDRVLDKISEQGMASLTPDERHLLDEVSRRYRHN